MHRTYPAAIAALVALPIVSVGCPSNTAAPATTPAKRRRFVFTFGLSPVIGPKRSELSENSGRAPIVKISRMIPPTPVAAP